MGNLMGSMLFKTLLAKRVGVLALLARIKRWGEFDAGANRIR